MSTEIINNVHHIDAIRVVTFDLDGEPQVMTYTEWLKFINWCHAADSIIKEKTML